VLRTRSPRAHTLYCYRMLRVRLACVKHAASVRSEPGSNSRLNPVLPNSPAGRLRKVQVKVRNVATRNSLGFCFQRVRRIFNRNMLRSEDRRSFAEFLFDERACRGNEKRTVDRSVSQKNRTGSGMFRPIVKEQTRNSKRASKISGLI
jgi:hypothetical protein